MVHTYSDLLHLTHALPDGFCAHARLSSILPWTGSILPVPDQPVLFLSCKLLFLPFGQFSSCYRSPEFFMSFDIFISEDYQPVELFEPKLFFKNTRSLSKCCIWVLLLPVTISAPIRDVMRHVSSPKAGIRSFP